MCFFLSGYIKLRYHPNGIKENIVKKGWTLDNKLEKQQSGQSIYIRLLYIFQDWMYSWDGGETKKKKEFFDVFSFRQKYIIWDTADTYLAFRLCNINMGAGQCSFWTFDGISLYWLRLLSGISMKCFRCGQCLSSKCNPKTWVFLYTSIYIALVLCRLSSIPSLLKRSIFKWDRMKWSKAAGSFITLKILS